MFANFFGNKENMNEENTNPEYFDESKIAGVTYYVGLDGEVQVDVEMFDYEEESITALSKVLTTLSMDSSYLQTVQMIQATLEEEGKNDALVTLYNHLATSPNDKALRIHKEKLKNKPCIRPSEML
jgi:hypothetical protein